MKKEKMKWLAAEVWQQNVSFVVEENLKRTSYDNPRN